MGLLSFFNVAESPPKSVLVAGTALFFLLFLYVWVDDFNRLQCSVPSEDDENVGGRAGIVSSCSGLGVTLIMFSAYVKVALISLAITVGFLAFDMAIVSTLLKPRSLLDAFLGKTAPHISFGVHATLVWMMNPRMRTALFTAVFTTMCAAMVANVWVEVRGGNAEERVVVARGLYAFQLISVISALAVVIV
jgi:hypothetical protein